jgi:hypothetical protein
MIHKLIPAMTCLLLMSFGPLQAPAATPAGPGWALVTYSWPNHSLPNSLGTLDFATNTFYGPFLQGSFDNGFLYNISVTPDGRYALIASLIDHSEAPQAEGGPSSPNYLFRVDLSNPKCPVLAGKLPFPIYVNCTAISPDGTFAIAALGYPTLVAIDLQSFTVAHVFNIPGAGGATGIAIGADNQTWVATTPWSDLVLYGTYSLAGGFTGPTSLDSVRAPQTVAISPDGQTAIVGSEDWRHPLVGYAIPSPGVLVQTTALVNAPGAEQIVFSPDGAVAYLNTVSYIATVNVTAPGVIALEDPHAAYIDQGGQVYGLTSIAVSKDGQRMLAGFVYPTRVYEISTSTFEITSLHTDKYGTGVASFGGSEGTVAARDDYGNSQLCLNPGSGSWTWHVLKGPDAGRVFSGVGSVTQSCDQLRLTSYEGGRFALSLYVLTRLHRATAVLVPPDGFACTLIDSNTQDDPACP